METFWLTNEHMNCLFVGDVFFHFFTRWFFSVGIYSLRIDRDTYLANRGNILIGNMSSLIYRFNQKAVVSIQMYPG